MPSLPRLSALTSPLADISQPRKLEVPQSTATKASGISPLEFVADVKSAFPPYQARSNASHSDPARSMSRCGGDFVGESQALSQSSSGASRRNHIDIHAPR